MADNNGISGGLEQTPLPLAMTLSAFTAIAWYNVIDLNVSIWVTFKRRRGLYFYSLLVSSWGIMIYALAFLMKFFQVWKNDYVSVALITIGWYAMVTGQSLVLYSRLHLVVRDKEKIKWVLYMIIIDVFLFHFPTTVLTFGVRDHHRGTDISWAKNPFRQIHLTLILSPRHIQSWKRFRSPDSVSRNSSSLVYTFTQQDKYSNQERPFRRSAFGESCDT
jgi:hypothetical protein